MDPTGPSDDPRLAGSSTPPSDPSNWEGTRGLERVTPWIEAHSRRRRRFRQICLGGLALGLVLLGTGVGIARWRGLAALDRELDTFGHRGASSVRPGCEARNLGPPESNDAVLMVHGWCSSPNDFGRVPKLLADRGYAVRVMRLPGHGTSPRDFAAATLEDWRAAVREEFTALDARHERVHLVGFSMGGALCTELASETAPASLTLIAPFFGLPYPRLFGLRAGSLAQYVEPLVPYVDSGPGVRTLACDEHEDEVFKYRAIPLSAVTEVDRIGAAVSDPELLQRIDAPLLAIASSGDRVASSERAFAALRQTSSEPRVEVELTNSDHILAWDCDADQLERAVLDFFSAP